MNPEIHKITKRFFSLMKPPPKLTVSQWADKYRRLSSESSPVSGKWNTSWGEYQREIMDAFTNPDVECVVMMTAAQVGKTEILNNICGYFISYDPAPILVVMPNGEAARAWSQERFSPMLRDTPSLRNKISDGKVRDSKNKILHKEFDGGYIAIVGAHSPAGLASRPIRIVLCDEVDRYPLSAGSEGDPVSLAMRRTANFWNKKILLISTPTDLGMSRIHDAYEKSDQRRFYVSCAHCKAEQVLDWNCIKWEDDSPEDAAIYCVECDKAWTETQRRQAIKKGRWIASKSFSGTAGFWLPGLYSPNMSIPKAVNQYLAVKNDPIQLKTWVNTYLGDVWRGDDSGMQFSDIRGRNSFPYGEVDDQIGIITCGVDVQDDRLELEVVGWGEGYQSWSLDYLVLYGCPGSIQVWEQLNEVLSKTYVVDDDLELPISCTCIDSGGHYTTEVYHYTKPRLGQRIFPIKGVAGEGRVSVSAPSKRNIGKVPLFALGVDSLKEIFYSRLRIEEIGAGFCHFPDNRDTEYYKQLTAEKKILKYTRGMKRYEWTPIRKANEALDCRIYAMAALGILCFRRDLSDVLRNMKFNKSIIDKKKIDFVSSCADKEYQIHVE